MSKSRKKSSQKPTVKSLLATAQEKGLAVTSVGVNLAALSGTSGAVTTQSVALPADGDGATRAAGIKATDIDWQRLPKLYWQGMSEKEWQRAVVAKARNNGWEAYHTRDSRGSDSGFPDLVCARIWPNGYWAKMFYAELKDEDGIQTEEQKQWEKLLTACGQVCYLWRPSMWAVVQRILTWEPDLP